jgi:hypothetical protein
MKYLLRKLIKPTVIITLSVCSAGCANLIGGFVDGLLESKEEARQRQQDPAVMIEKIDRERAEETAQDIQRQNQKEEAARKKQFDDLLQRQLEQQQLPKSDH